MASQTPEDDDQASREYKNAWSSVRRRVMEDGISWSGSEHNFAYLNLGDGTFSDVSVISGADCIGDGRALALTDWDDDGRLDLVLRNRTAPRLQLFRNQAADDSRFVAFTLEGKTCNRDAIGARVVVEAGGRTLRKTLHAGDGFLATSTKRLLFGLGRAETVDRVRVLWPDGTKDEYTDLAVDTRYAIVQGDARPDVVPAATASGLASVAPQPAEKDERGVARLALQEKLPLLPLRVPAFDDPNRTVDDLTGSPVLINLWGTECEACAREFAEFRQRSDDIRRSKLRIVPLCTDPETRYARAREILEVNDLEGDAGAIDEPLVRFLEVLFAHLVGSSEETPLPTSLLLDSAGQLVAVYFGRVEVDELLRDVELAEQADPKDLGDTRLVFGRLVVERRRALGRLIEGLEEIGRQDLVEYYREVGRSRRQR